MKATNLVDPPGDSGRIEEVREVNGAGPNLGQVRVAIVFDEDVFGYSSLVNRISGVDGDSRVD